MQVINFLYSIVFTLEKVSSETFLLNCLHDADEGFFYEEKRNWFTF